MKPVKVGILGLGTVGGGAAKVLQRNAAEIARRAGREIIITRASASDLSKPRLCDTSNIELTTNGFDIINDPEIDIIIETIGGAGIVKDMVLQAIENGKHVVTANKSLIALHGNEIFAKASEKGVIVAFEAAVAGGIPIIKAIREGLSGNQIEWLAGIINGTSNFILTEMRDKGRDFSDVLAEAQALGYAEADPTFDVEGIDAGHKLTILASIAFGIPLQFDKVYTEGITQITRTDVEYAEQLGYRIKSLGVARKTEKGIELRVHPTLIPERRLIANVDGVMNAVLVKGDAVGATMYYGAGAGAEPTGSAIVADVIDVVRALACQSSTERATNCSLPNRQLRNVLDSGDFQTAYYLRLQTEDKPGVLADVTRILADCDISIEAILQKTLSSLPNRQLRERIQAQYGDSQSSLPNRQLREIILLTQVTQEHRLNLAITNIEQLETVSGKVNRIRLETLG